MRLRHFPALTALALLGPAAAAHAAVTPPPPTGPAPVGVVRVTLTDHQRTEHLPAGGGPPHRPPAAPPPRGGRAPAPDPTARVVPGGTARHGSRRGPDHGRATGVRV